MPPGSTPFDRNPNDLTTIRLAGYRGWINRQYDTPPFREAVKKFLLSGFATQPAIAASFDRRVYRVPVGEDSVFIKIYYITNLKHFIKTLFRVNKAQKAWQFGRRLIAKGIPTPFPIAYLRSRRFIVPLEHAVITAGIPNSVTLRRFVYDRSDPLTKPCKINLIRELARLLGRLHMADIYHGDFTSHNIIVESLPAPQYIRVYLADLDAVDSRFWISFRRRIKNLDEIGRNFLSLRLLSTADRARFLRVYLETYTKESRTFKEMFKSVLDRTRFRLKKYGKDFIRG